MKKTYRRQRINRRARCGCGTLTCGRRQRTPVRRASPIERRDAGKSSSSNRAPSATPPVAPPPLDACEPPPPHLRTLPSHYRHTTRTPCRMSRSLPDTHLDSEECSSSRSTPTPSAEGTHSNVRYSWQNILHNLSWLHNY